MTTVAALATRSLAMFVMAASVFGIAQAQQAQQAKPAAAPDMGLGQAKSASVCVACHANDGSRGSPAYPIIEGQHPEYLIKQLTEYKTGKRKNVIMNGMAAVLTETDIRNVAAFYASKQARPGFAKHADTVETGEKIYRGGIAERNVPACAGCHSPDGAGIPAQYPRLSGQHADYTTAQLMAFRSGVRSTSAVMMGIAGKLNDREIKAVADYVTGLR